MHHLEVEVTQSCQSRHCTKVYWELLSAVHMACYSNIDKYLLLLWSRSSSKIMTAQSNSFVLEELSPVQRNQVISGFTFIFFIDMKNCYEVPSVSELEEILGWEYLCAGTEIETIHNPHKYRVKLFIFKTHIFSSCIHSLGCKNIQVPQNNKFCLF